MNDSFRTKSIASILTVPQYTLKLRSITLDILFLSVLFQFRVSLWFCRPIFFSKSGAFFKTLDNVFLSAVRLLQTLAAKISLTDHPPHSLQGARECVCASVGMCVCVCERVNVCVFEGSTSSLPVFPQPPFSCCAQSVL